MKRMLALSASVAAMALMPVPASAGDLAIFGANNIGTLYTADGHNVTYVTDGQLATAGFLDAFDAFIYTRNGSSFGVGLSLAAAANVSAFVTGNIVIFNGDFQDDIGAVGTNNLFLNALDYVLGGSGKGYIGEYRGAFAAYSSNADGNNPLGLIQGSSGTSGYAQGGSDTQIDLTAAGLASPITAGTPFPYNPSAVEFGAQLSGENPDKVLARFANGNAAIIASSRDEISLPGGVPEPSTWALLILGFAGIGASLRAQRKSQRVTLRYA